MFASGFKKRAFSRANHAHRQRLLVRGAPPPNNTTELLVPDFDPIHLVWMVSEMESKQPVENRSTDILSVSFPIGITDWKSVVRAFSTG